MEKIFAKMKTKTQAMMKVMLQKEQNGLRETIEKIVVIGIKTKVNVLMNAGENWS